MKAEDLRLSGHRTTSVMTAVAGESVSKSKQARWSDSTEPVDFLSEWEC